MTAPDDDDDDCPTSTCPRCKRDRPDLDGFGVVYCDPADGGCGFCRHPDQVGVDARWVCGICGKDCGAV